MNFLKFLEGLRTPFLNELFLLITHLGEELVFLVFAIVIFWCVSKREGYYILITGLVGTVCNQTLKLACKVRRPWTHPGFSAVEGAVPEATGYSFPSGHTQNAAGTFGCVARWSKRTFVRITFITLAVLVAFSRMYLGVHFPTDVFFSVLLASLLVFLLYPIFKSEESFHKYMPCVVSVSVLLAVGNLLYAVLTPEAGVDPANLASALKNGATLVGCTAGLIPVYILDRCVIKFETDARWYAQIIKLAAGLAIVLLIKEGLSTPLEMLFGNEYVARAVRYFLIVMFAGAVWPLTFKWFSTLRIGFLERFTDLLHGLFNRIFKSKKAK